MTLLQETISPDLKRGAVAVRCRGVTKSFDAAGTKVTALRGIDVDIHTGELMMLVGPSGCGKTTLISVIAGILDNDEGECTVSGLFFRRLICCRRSPPLKMCRYRC
jgi:putative ABC transport system ATP-binding protein